jgi:hypothetical protein
MVKEAGVRICQCTQEGSCVYEGVYVHVSVDMHAGGYVYSLRKG